MADQSAVGDTIWGVFQNRHIPPIRATLIVCPIPTERLSLDPISLRHVPPAMCGDPQGINFCRPVSVFQSVAVMLPNCGTNRPRTP